MRAAFLLRESRSRISTTPPQHISQRVKHCNLGPVVLQCALHPCQIAVLVHQPHSICLAQRMSTQIDLEAARLLRSVDVTPHGLARSVSLRVDWRRKRPRAATSSAQNVIA